LRPCNFFGHRGIRVINADRIDLHIRLAHHPLNLVFRVAAVVVAPVGDDEQRLPLVLGLAHLVHPQIDRIKQRGPVLGLQQGQLFLDVLDAIGEVGQNFRLIVKRDNEEFVIRIGGLEEFDNRLARLVDLVRHRAADIEDHSDGYGRVFTREMFDLLFYPGVEDVEVFIFQAGDKPIIRIGDGDRHEHNVDIHTHGPRVCLQIWISLRDFRLFFFPRLYMDIVGINLGEARNGKSAPHHQYRGPTKKVNS